jgi:5-formyltetrahydrofolate cyclo-ligase
MNKKELRENALRIRNGFTKQQVSDSSYEIVSKLLNHPWYRECRTLFTYVSMDNEVQTHSLIEEAISDGKRVCVPRVVPKEHMVAVPIRNLADDLKKGFFNVLEPMAQLQPVSHQEIDLVIVPGLVYDREGYRIGYGGGYYDKYLEIIPSRCHTVGLAFHTLITDRIQREAHDKKVMLVITEQELIG